MAQPTKTTHVKSPTMGLLNTHEVNQHNHFSYGTPERECIHKV